MNEKTLNGIEAHNGSTYTRMSLRPNIQNRRPRPCDDAQTVSRLTLGGFHCHFSPSGSITNNFERQETRKPAGSLDMELACTTGVLKGLGDPLAPPKVTETSST